jgi:hypothetical protein
MDVVFQHLTGNIIWYIIGVLATLLYHLFMQGQAMKRATIAMLKRDIIGLYHIAITKGSFTLIECEVMEDLYVNYHRLGANGSIDKVYKLYHQLPMREDENTPK